MRDVTDLRAAVVGTGFIGVVHVDTLRRLGVQVLGVVGSSPERARAKSGPIPLPDPYDSFDDMLADDRVDIVHLTTPNFETDKGGPLRAVADIGSHWLDLVQFVTGRRVTHLLWLGHRDRPTETLTRDPALLEPDAAVPS
jgi:predicted dehydrogenase